MGGGNRCMEILPGNGIWGMRGKDKGGGGTREVLEEGNRGSRKWRGL